jgi:SAM-dependent methyltransferase
MTEPSADPRESLHGRMTAHYLATTAARGFNRSPKHYEAASAYLTGRIGRWLPAQKDGLCVDLACGLGELLYMLQSKGYTRLTGVDLCKPELDEAARFTSAELHHADICEFLGTLPDGSVTMITALNILEHLSKDRLGDVMRECRRALRPGGVMIIMVPNAISPHGALTRYWDITHEWAFTPNNFRQLGALYGFSPEVDVRECGPIAHGVISGIRYALWQLMRARIAFGLLVELGSAKGGVYTMDMLVRLHASPE